MKLYSVKYFQRPYSDDEYLSESTKIVGDRKYKIYRPNHGVAHSLRQGMLARDLLHAITHFPSVSHSTFDDKFCIKVAILASFQRSGRQSEISNTGNPELYLKYQQQDIRNFIEAVDEDYFCCENEKYRWSQALLWDLPPTEDELVIFLNKVIKVAHLLDLRRIPRFDEDRIRAEISRLLDVDPYSDLINIMWKQSGVYLYVSGDRDLVKQYTPREDPLPFNLWNLNPLMQQLPNLEAKTWWSDRFYTLQQDPVYLYKLLRRHLLCNRNL